MRFAVSFALLWALCSSVPALAQDAAAPHEPPPEAIALYQHGRELYRLGRYRDAVAELERALMLDPTSPNLVYNVARVHELLGELPEAIRYYERYLAVLPHDETEERERTQGTIMRLRGAQQEVHVPPPPPPGGGGEQLRDVGPEVHVRHGVADEAFWATTIGAGVTLAAAGVVGILAVLRDQDVANFTADGTTLRSDRDAMIDQVRTLALATDILFGVSAVAALCATFLYFLRDRVEVTPRERAPESGSALLAPFVVPTLGGAVLGVGATL